MPKSDKTNLTTVPALINSGILADAHLATNKFMEGMRVKLTSSRVLSNPCILFVPGCFTLGEYSLLQSHSPSGEVRELASFAPWNGMTESQIASFLLQERSHAYDSLVRIGITLGVREKLGESPSRSELSFEGISEFVATLLAHMYEEAHV